MAKGAELRHWSDMLAYPRRAVAQWHSLKDIQGRLLLEFPSAVAYWHSIKDSQGTKIHKVVAQKTLTPQGNSR